MFMRFLPDRNTLVNLYQGGIYVSLSAARSTPTEKHTDVTAHSRYDGDGGSEG